MLVVGLASGCREAKVTAYRAPKDPAPAGAPTATPPAAAAGASVTPTATPVATPTMANTAVPTASGADLKWTAPADWDVKPASAMRKATYVIKGEGAETAELSVTAFPGDVGGEAANLTRWRGQLGLPDASTAETAAAVSRFEANGLKIVLADFSNEKASPPARLLGAIVPAGESTWFFKLTGSPALLEKNKAAFTAFLKTIKLP